MKVIISWWLKIQRKIIARQNLYYGHFLRVAGTRQQEKISNTTHLHCCVATGGLGLQSYRSHVADIGPDFITNFTFIQTLNGFYIGNKLEHA